MKKVLITGGAGQILLGFLMNKLVIGTLQHNLRNRDIIYPQTQQSDYTQLQIIA